LETKMHTEKMDNTIDGGTAGPTIKP